MFNSLDDIEWTAAMMGEIPVLALVSESPVFGENARGAPLTRVLARWECDVQPHMDVDLILTATAFIVLSNVGVLLRADLRDLPEKLTVQKIITNSTAGDPWLLFMEYVEDGKQKARVYEMRGSEDAQNVTESVFLDYWPVMFSEDNR